MHDEGPGGGVAAVPVNQFAPGDDPLPEGGEVDIGSGGAVGVSVCPVEEAEVEPPSLRIGEQPRQHALLEPVVRVYMEEVLPRGEGEGGVAGRAESAILLMVIDEVWLPLRIRPSDLSRLVRAPVVDEDHLVAPDLQSLSEERVETLPQVGRDVVDRDQYGELFRHRCTTSAR